MGDRWTLGRIAPMVGVALVSLGLLATGYQILLNGSGSGHLAPVTAKMVAKTSPRPIATSGLQSPSPPSPSPIPTPSAQFPPVVQSQPTISVTITGSDYGWIQAKAPAGATCTATADADGSQISDPNLGAPQTAGADGVLQWRYQQQGERSGTGHNIVTCTLGPASGSATNEFNVGN